MPESRRPRRGWAAWTHCGASPWKSCLWMRDRLDEARVVIPFWQAAIREAEFADLNDESMLQWRKSMRGWLAEEAERGTLRAGIRPEVAAESLLTFSAGVPGGGGA